MTGGFLHKIILSVGFVHLCYIYHIKNIAFLNIGIYYLSAYFAAMAINSPVVFSMDCTQAYSYLP